ncbi:MAG: Uma2 family endonuclease [Cyanobacteria bacterium]|jgi:Uma2 family endonuclease|nr:Uma2 family endonuclease [Cyanobacteria bacterium GSL.Bin1]
MVSQPVEQKKYTCQEYLDFEVNSPERHEYLDGEIRSMVGGTPNHNRIIGNTYFAFKLALQGSKYDIFFSEQRLWIPEKNIYTYPDLMVIQGELQLQEGRKDTITNPCLITEVLSNSTKDYDKNEQFKAYRSLSSFQEYVLIDQSSPQIEHYRKTDTNQWLFTEYHGLDSILTLAVGKITTPLANIYDQVTFE